MTVTYMLCTIVMLAINTLCFLRGVDLSFNFPKELIYDIKGILVYCLKEAG